MPILRKRVKYNSKIKQQQQHTNYIKKFMSVLKNKITYKLKKASDKTEAKQNNKKLYFTRKDMRPLYQKAR